MSTASVTTLRPRRRRAPWIALALAVLLGCALVALASLRGATTYYITPTELLRGSAAGDGGTVRLSGMVLGEPSGRPPDPGSFRLTDGVTTVPVANGGTVPAMYAPGRVVVVEGVLGDDGVFRAENTLVKHSNVYGTEDAGGVAAERGGGNP